MIFIKILVLYTIVYTCNNIATMLEGNRSGLLASRFLKAWHPDFLKPCSMVRVYNKAIAILTYVELTLEYFRTGSLYPDIFCKEPLHQLKKRNICNPMFSTQLN